MILRVCQGSWRTRPYIIISFNGTCNIWGVNLREQGISLLLKGILAKDFREQWNLLIENNGEEVKFSREHANPTPPPLFPERLLSNESRIHGQCQLKLQAWVVQRLDNAIHRINHYPVDSMFCFVNTYPLDSDLSGG